jgi:hypothetical protein
MALAAYAGEFTSVTGLATGLLSLQDVIMPPATVSVELSVASNQS